MIDPFPLVGLEYDFRCSTGPGGAGSGADANPCSSAKGPSLSLWLLLFLAPPLPIAVYLLVLGVLNRGRHPVLVSGVWDFVGVLFAASGFLLCGGPILISLLNDRWRDAWLFQDSGPNAPDSVGSSFWLFLFFLYYVFIVAAAVFLLRRQRHLTAIYNVQPETVETALDQVFVRLGLTPVRNGSVYSFDATDSKQTAKGIQSEAIQVAPHRMAPPGEAIDPAPTLAIESFALMQHVTLRWQPAEWWLRPEIESALAQQLQEHTLQRYELGAWLTVLGVSILAITLTGGCAGVLVLLMTR